MRRSRRSVRPAGPGVNRAAQGLLRAVRGFLATEITGGPGTAGADPRLVFHARVAALGCADDAGLCAAIRNGSLDHRFDEVIDAVRAMTVDKLTVANPGHLARPG